MTTTTSSPPGLRAVEGTVLSGGPVMSAVVLGCAMPALLLLSGPA
ncbi:hypothetical protein [Sinosporangium siamense]|nr:hypothetical protein [Sinosporangium siamense]